MSWLETTKVRGHIFCEIFIIRISGLKMEAKFQKNLQSVHLIVLHHYHQWWEFVRWQNPTIIIADKFPPWWEFVMVGICWVTIFIIFIIFMAYRHIPTMTKTHHGGFLSAMIMVGFCHQQIPTLFITDKFPPWWVFVMVGMCWKAIIIIMVIIMVDSDYDHHHHRMWRFDIALDLLKHPELEVSAKMFQTHVGIFFCMQQTQNGCPGLYFHHRHMYIWKIYFLSPSWFLPSSHSLSTSSPVC